MKQYPITADDWTVRQMLWQYTAALRMSKADLKRMISRCERTLRRRVGPTLRISLTLPKDRPGGLVWRLHDELYRDFVHTGRYSYPERRNGIFRVMEWEEREGAYRVDVFVYSSSSWAYIKRLVLFLMRNLRVGES